ncbi:hypothetical protein [Oceanobacillus halophilus]|uniref:Uncharacterized protein n=1 Tax=Oceanobacillus halophilus TaxID=930130 RepID=A0A495A0Q3_9BACI|nr:hypothetical protein [Oceanobacillus halophilus]RKQ32974.1 hypothetical protein D8M06_11285 [Oceanobacillus halophilus]
MNQFTGGVFAGEFDQGNDNFYLTEVKSLQTGSVLSKKQLSDLYQYLNNQNDTCMITVNDQMPILIQKDEIDLLLRDIGDIMQSLKN